MSRSPLPSHPPQVVAWLRRHAVAVVVLVLVPAVWWWPLLGGWLPNYMDVVALHLPMRLEAARQLREGVPPLWLPNLMAGMPLAANPQLALWYPPMWLFLAFPGAVGWGLVVLFHYALAGIGMYVAVLKLGGGSRAAALIAALALQLGAYMLTRIALPTNLVAAAWLPWLFLATEYALRCNRAAIALAVLATLQFLAGAPQITYYTAFGLGAYALVRIVQSAVSLREAGFMVLRLGAAGGLALLMACVQLLPSLEMVAHSERAAIDLDRLRAQGLSGARLWQSLVGGTQSPLEHVDALYAPGLVILLLAVLPFVRRGVRRQRAVALIAAAAVGYLLGLAALVPFWAGILPLYEGFHNPQRALVLTHFALVMLGGFGAARYFAWTRLRGIDRLTSDAFRTIGGLGHRWIVVFGERLRLDRWSAWGLVILVLAGSLWIVPRIEREFVRPSHFDIPQELVETIGDARFLTIDPMLRYAHDSREEDYGASLRPNLAAWHGLYDVQGFDPLISERYGMTRLGAFGSHGVLYPSHSVVFTNPASPALQFLNVQYIVGRWDLFSMPDFIPTERIDVEAFAESVEPIVDDLRWPLYRYREERPVAWFAETVRPEANPEQALHQAAFQRDPHAVAFVEFVSENPVRLLEGEWNLERLDARTWSVELHSPAEEEHLLVLSTTWFPGWVARDDRGGRLLTTPVNGFLLGVYVPAGTGEIRVRYAPASQRNGALMTLLGVLLAVAWWQRGRR